MLASAASTYVNRYGVAPGRRAVVFTNNDSAYRAALDLVDAGVDVRAVVDVRPETHGKLPSMVDGRGVEVLPGQVLVDVRGGRGVKAVEVRRVDGGSVVGGSRRLECDLVATSGGWNPTLNLHSQSGGQPRFDDYRSCFVPGPSAQAERSAGSCNGGFSLGECLAQGHAAGADAAGAAGFGDGLPSSSAPDTDDHAEAPTSACWVVPGTRPAGRDRKRFVDLQTDTTVADIAVSAREGLRTDRACQALHHAGDGYGPGPDGRGQRDRRARRNTRQADPGNRDYHVPTTIHAGHVRRYGGPRSRRTLRPCPEDGDARLARPGRGEVRGRRSMEASLVLSPARRVDARRGQPGVPRRAGRGRSPRRLDPRQDRRQGPGRGDVSEPRLRQWVDAARHRTLPLRLHAQRRGHGSRRRRHRTARRASLSDAHDHLRSSRRDGVARAMVADRVAGSQRVSDVGDRPLGDRVDQRATRSAGHGDAVQ